MEVVGQASTNKYVDWSQAKASQDVGLQGLIQTHPPARRVADVRDRQ
jgi:hypothetical protein